MWPHQAQTESNVCSIKKFKNIFWLNIIFKIKVGETIEVFISFKIYSVFESSI